MKKLVLVVLFSAIFSIVGNSQNSLWTITNVAKLADVQKFDRTTVPSEFLLYHLKLDAFKEVLATAPLDSSGQISNAQVSFPNPSGVLENYIVYEAPVIEQGLANKYPELKSYVAKGINDPTASIRFSITTFGLHAMLTSGDVGTFYIDSYTKDLQNYIVYSKNKIVNNKPFTCSVQDQVTEVANEVFEAQSTFANDGLFRQYRLALACTIEYAAYHVNAAGLNAGTIAQKKAAVLSAMVVTITRVNGIYEKDLSVRMNLVANNDALIFIDSDNFSNNDSNALINESQTTIDNLIGNANYDIGHTVSTGGGGLAGVGVICITGSKGSGITGLPSPVGDAFDVDFVAHEVGHQFGAKHTFSNSCSNNINQPTAVEPGSGSTIMAYAGVCSPNVQTHSDDYFHAISIAQMTTRILSTSCAAATSNGNFAPVVNAGPDFVIPKGTPFILKGSATDANNDALTYCWEQTDAQSSVQSPLNTSTAGPNFRSRTPSTSPNRYMPLITNVVGNNLSPTWEVVPNVARTMNFALTVRDNRTPNGGQTNRDDMIVTTAAVGPFLVSTPNTAVSWQVGSNQNVTWDVAGTDSNGINASFVDILLSTNGGTQYPILLASKVPNDGSETITVPNNPGTTNRIMVRGYNHIFYDISNTNFTITSAPSNFAISFSGAADGQNKIVCTESSASFSLNYTTFSGFSGTTTFSAAGTPPGATVSFSPSTMSTTGPVTMTVGNPAGVSGDFQIVVSAISGSTTKTVPLYLTVGLGSVILTAPANNATSQNTNNLNLTWNSNPLATSYNVQVALDNSFTSIISAGNVTANAYSLSGLNPNFTYYWRVAPNSPSCNGDYTSPFKFTTTNINCGTTNLTNLSIPILTTISSISSTLNIPTGTIISDVKVILNITHTWVADLRVTIKSPAGTSVQLFSGVCGSSDNINATFDDAGVAIVCGTNPAILGTVKPSSPLSAFNNQNSAGSWELKIEDLAGGDGGFLNSWGLEICSVQPVIQWTGTTSNDWSVASNWSNNQVPDGSYSIEIPLGNPVLATNYTVQSGNFVKVSGTGSLALAPTALLNIQGMADFGNLPITLQSDATGTASIGQINGFLINATNVTAERYIPAKRAWRLLTAPLTGDTNNSLFYNWQNNGAEGDNTTGLLLWSPSGTATPTNGNNGLFLGPQANARTYVNGAFANIANSNSTLLFTATENNPFLVFVTGPHASTNISGTGAAATTAKATGKLITGTVTKSLNAGEFKLIGNPYASPIAPQSLINTNANAKLWMINPSLGSYGAYVAYDGNWSIEPAPSLFDAYIQSGQAFFARTSAASTFEINENHKVAGNSNNWFERNANDDTVTESVDKIRVLLYKQIESNWTIADGILAVNQLSGSNEVTEKDAGKISNFNESLMFRNNTSNLSIEYRALPQMGDIQNLRLTGTTTIPYQLRLYTQEYTNSALQPYLEDTASGTLTAIPTDGTEVVVPFTGVASTSTNPDNRFRIVYQTNLSTVDNNKLVVSVFPNPVVNNQLNVNLGQDAVNAEYTITNLLGQSIQKGTLVNIQNVLTLSSAGQGFYILNIRHDGKSFTTKIHVQ